MRMRIAAAIFIAAHGVGFVIWFLRTWIPSARGASGRAQRPGGGQPSFFVEPASGGGKALGILALLVLVGFVVSAFVVWTQASSTENSSRELDALPGQRGIRFPTQATADTSPLPGR
jgi:hypothetical protein